MMRFRTPSVGYLVGAAIQGFSVLLIAPVATRVLGPSEYGVLAVALVASQILAVVIALGMSGAITRLAFGDEGRRDLASATEIVGGALLLVLTLGAVAAVTAASWGSQIGGALGESEVARTAALLAVASALVQLPQAHHRATGRVGAFVGTVFGWTVTAQVTGLLSATLREPSAIHYLEGMAAAAALTAVVSLTSVTPKGRPLPDRALTLRALRFGVPVVPHALGLLLVMAGDRIVIERIAGDVSAGRYQVAYLVGGASLAVLAALNNHWGPAVYGAHREDRVVALTTSTESMLVIAAALSVGMVATSPWILPILAGDGFGAADLDGVVAIVALSAIPYVFYLSSMHVVFLSERTGVLAVITPLMAALNLGLNLLWVGPYGLPGAAWATVLTFICWSAILKVAVRGRMTVRLDARRCAVVVVSSLIAVIVVSSVPRTTWATALRVAVAGVSARLVVLRLDLGITDRPSHETSVSDDRRRQ